MPSVSPSRFSLDLKASSLNVVFCHSWISCAAASRAPIAFAVLPSPALPRAPTGGHTSARCCNLALALRPAAERPLARPAAFGPDFVASAILAPCTATDVTPKYRGLPPAALEKAFRAEHPGLLEALAGACAAIAPPTAAPLLRRLEAELPPALYDVAPGGDCVLVAIAPGLLPLLEHAAECAEQSLGACHLDNAAATAHAALSFLSCLRFSGASSAAPYAALGIRCKQTLQAAYTAGAAVSQDDMVGLYTACARADAWLWLAPYAGHRAACTLDNFITAGWRDGELAVRFTEAHATLIRRGRLIQVERTFVRLVQASMRHPLSLSQVDRLLAASSQLPVEMSIQLALNARSEPTNDWHSQLLQLQRQLQQREQDQQQRDGLQRPMLLPMPRRHRGAMARKLVPAGKLQRT